MSRKLIGAATLAALLLALLLIAAVLLLTYQHMYQAGEAIEKYEQQVGRMDTYAIDQHRKLARWYNFCLSSGQNSESSRNAYHTILNISDGMMGYLTDFNEDWYLPIYHNAVLPQGFYGAGHVADSALPVGGRGNHTVLMVPAEAAGLQQGDSFCIHIPGDVLHFRVREVKLVSPGQTEGVLPVKDEELCTLSATSSEGKILIHGIRWEPKTKPDKDKAEFSIVAYAMLAALFLPAATGGAGSICRRLIRVLNCKRLTKINT